jgi:hypothetical protein
VNTTPAATATTALPVISSEAGLDTGTEYGISTYSQLLSCPKSVYLKKLYKQEPSEAKFDDSNEGNRIGRYFHALAANYHGQEKSPYWHMPTILSDEVSADEKLEGERLMQAYTQVIKPDTYGEVIAVEYTLPESAAHIEAVKDAGLWPLTGQLDMVVRTNEEQADALTDNFELDIWPGIWNVDYKTTARNTEIRKLSILEGMQFIGYPMLWDICNPYIPIEGTIVVHLYRYTKKVEIGFDVIPYPNAHKQRIFREWLKTAQDIVDQRAWRANPASCFSGFKPCALYTAGLCNRLSDVTGKPLPTTKPSI